MNPKTNPLLSPVLNKGPGTKEPTKYGKYEEDEVREMTTDDYESLSEHSMRDDESCLLDVVKEISKEEYQEQFVSPRLKKKEVFEESRRTFREEQRTFFVSAL